MITTMPPAGGSSGGAHRAHPDDDAARAAAVYDPDAPRTVRIGGVKVLTAGPYKQLRQEATGPGRKGRKARRRLKTENNRRKTAIERAAMSDGFERSVRIPSRRGHAGPGAGRVRAVGKLPEWRATTTQAAGLWPFVLGASSPMLGTPVGSHLYTGADVGFDPLSHFSAGLITAPITFVLALNGYGKSSLVRRIATGTMAQGHTVLFMGDTKPDYVELVKAVGGQVITLGDGAQQINPLAVGALGTVMDSLDPGKPEHVELRAKVVHQVRARQLSMVRGLLAIDREEPVKNFERTLIASALDWLYSAGGFTPQHPPILEDLYAVVEGGSTDEMRTRGGIDLWADAGADSAEQYRELTRPLRTSLRSLVRGTFGDIFNGQTTEPIRIDSPAVVVDISKIPEDEANLLAAVLMVCWSDGFGAVEGAHILADAGLAPRRNFLVVMDELWRVLGAGAGMVDRVNALTRLNRTIGTALIMITHTIKDLASFKDPADVQKALGFIERARSKIIGPVGTEELQRLSAVMKFTMSEIREISGWASTPPPTSSTLARIKRGKRQRPAGTGCFMLKVGDGEENRPGTPFRLDFVSLETESGIHDTNSRFQMGIDDELVGAA